MKDNYPFITTQDNYLKIRQATKEGFIEFEEDRGVADLSFPTSKLRRGRVQGNPPGSISPALTTTGGLYVIKVIDDIN